eukprot:SAG11_NODE_180_length_13278_cov_9.158434_11_plen_218_part_00
MLPNGVTALGQQNSLEPRVQRALGLASTTASGDGAVLPSSSYEVFFAACLTVAIATHGMHLTVNAWCKVLERLAGSGILEGMAGRLSYREDPNKKREKRARPDNGKEDLASQWEVLKKKCPPEMRHTVYMSEVRRTVSETRPGAPVRRWRKSWLESTLRERAGELGLDARDMLYWDDYSEGTFIGGALSAAFIPSVCSTHIVGLVCHRRCAFCRLCA